MNYVIKIENLDCANCAAKVEAGVSKLDGVKKCAVNFFTLKMNLETEGEINDELLNKIRKISKRIEPDIRLSL